MGFADIWMICSAIMIIVILAMYIKGDVYGVKMDEVDFCGAISLIALSPLVIAAFIAVGIWDLYKIVRRKLFS